MGLCCYLVDSGEGKSVCGNIFLYMTYDGQMK